MAKLWRRRLFWLILGLGIWLGMVLLVVTHFVCVRAWLAYGVVVPDCPQGALRQTVLLEADGLRRGDGGSVRVQALAHYTTGPADQHLTATVRRLRAELSLLDAEQRPQALTVLDPWYETRDHKRWAYVRLPEVPDGDYTLRATVSTPLGQTVQELALPLYAPARVHLITDRPLYEPGNTVRFRAVVLRAKDLAPLDGRPGRWMVLDPDGEVLLEERAPAGPWGVAVGSFPLDARAASGRWTVRYVSGEAQDEVGFQVAPFTLPRFRVEAMPGQPFYRPGDRPELAGAVRYSSGAPVSGAMVQLAWSSAGSWPPPVEWLEGGPAGLPHQTVTGADGRFRLLLPRIPGDLQGQVVLQARLAAIDPAGDRVEGAAAVLLARDPIQVSAVTELAGGLVEGFNNRLYLRVTTADGRVLAGSEIRVKRAWEPADPGIRSTTDEDGVASLQIDPGPPVNVVIPPLPVRPEPRRAAIQRTGVEELLHGAAASLADQVALDGWMARLEPCARFAAHGSESVRIGLRVDAAGRVRAAAAAKAPLAACLKDALARLALVPGLDRMYLVDFYVESPDLPWLQPELAGSPAVPSELEQALNAGPLLDARGCLPEDAGEGWLPRLVEWRTQPGSRLLQLAWRDDLRAAGSPGPAPAVQRCIEQRLAAWKLEDEAKEEALGVLRLQVQPAQRARVARAQATTLLGYELEVTAWEHGQELGTTRVRLEPGAVPPLRLRITPVLARPGGQVQVELIRGPGFSGELPEMLHLVLQDGSLLEAKLDEQTRTARFTLPPQAKGWASVSLYYGAQAFAYVLSGADLTLELKPGSERYAPGQSAELFLQTRLGDRGAAAAVGLFGVDESLAQLAPLPGADDMARLRPTAEVSSPAFGLLDGQALAMGRIRGANAAAATILRLSRIPAPPELDVSVFANAQGAFDPVEELTDRFYVVLAEHYAQVRSWEEHAPQGELMRPETMARLWARALAVCAERGEAVSDAYGGRLRLSRLPPDLLALTGPRAAVVEGTRLPEDIEDWSGWVRRNEP